MAASPQAPPGVDDLLGRFPAPTRTRRPHAAAVAAATLAVLLAAGGVVVDRAMFRLGRDTPALLRDSALARGRTAGLAEDVPTSFGVVAVESITKTAGPTAKALAGVTHGIQSLVPPDKVGVEAAVTVTNLLARPEAYAPSQFRLYATKGGEPGSRDKPIPLARASVQPGTLQPDASIDANLMYVAPRNGAKLWMTFEDPAAERPILVDLGRTGRTPPGALDAYRAHRHQGGTP